MMHNWRTIFLLLIWAGAIAGCGTPREAGHWWLDGDVPGFKGKAYLASAQAAGLTMVDSIQVDENGHFSFTRPVDAGLFYELHFEGKRQKFPFLPTETDLKFNWNQTKPKEWGFIGNVESQVMEGFIRERGRLFSQYIEEKKRLRMIPKSTTLERWREQEAKVDAGLLTYRGFLRAFVDTTSIPEMRGYALYSLNADGNYDYIRQKLNEMDANGENTNFLSALRAQLDAIQEPWLSTNPTDIVGETPTGGEAHLNENNGQLTLLYFWADYCKYSQEENEILADLYNTYKDRGFSIFSVAIDDYKSGWEANAVNIPWPGNIWQPGGWNARALTGYDIMSIPTTYLIGAKGGILTKNIRAEDLRDQMEQLLADHGPQQ